jgi:hypothetical protein
VTRALGIPPGLLGFPGTPPDPADLARALDVPFDDAGAAKAVLLTAVRLLVDPHRSLPPAGSRIGMSDVDRVRQHVGLFRLVDERIGGGELRHLITSYVGRTADLLTGRISDPATRIELLRLIGELHIMASWMHLDVEESVTARTQWDAAMRIARASREPMLAAHGLLSRGQSLYDHQRYDLALEAMGRARSVMDRHPPMAGTMVITAHEAMVHADTGNREAALSALGRAQDAYVAAERDDPQWSFLRSEMWLTLAEGRVLTRLAHAGRGDAGKGAALVRRATAMNAAAPGRTSAVMYRELAVAELAVDGLDDAKLAFRKGLQAASNLDSSRALRRLRQDFRRYALPHAPRDEEIRDLGRTIGVL